MEIKDFGELNALNKLLGRIKFQSDLDFFEFKEFAGSPLIADIFKRVNEEFIAEAAKRGHVSTDYRPEFKFDSITGQTLCMRIDELTEKDRNTLRNLGESVVDEHLRTLITPLHATQDEFNQLRQYAYSKIMRNS